MSTEHLWRRHRELGGLVAEGQKLGGWEGGKETSYICSFGLLELEPHTFYLKKKNNYNILKEYEPATAYAPCLEMKLSQRPAELEKEKHSCWHSVNTWILLLQLCEHSVSPFSLNLFELCWQVSWLLCPSKILLCVFFWDLLMYTWQTCCFNYLFSCVLLQLLMPAECLAL